MSQILASTPASTPTPSWYPLSSIASLPALVLPVLLVASLCVTGSDGLHDVHLEAPAYVRRSEPLTMSCRYQLDNDTLYTVKWYRGNQEFYRFVPKEVPPTQIFYALGNLVDLRYSNQHDVVLESAPMEISGLFKCLVSVEHTFKTLQDSKRLTVVAVGYGSPILSVDKQCEDQFCQFHPGENISAKCSVSQTFPPTNITWYIGDREVLPNMPRTSLRTSSAKDSQDPAVFNTVSIINYTLPLNFKLIQLKCTGRLYDVYHASSIFEFHRRDPQQPTINASHTNNNNFQSSPTTNTLKRSTSKSSSASAEIPQFSPGDTQFYLIILLHLMLNFRYRY